MGGVSGTRKGKGTASTRNRAYQFLVPRCFCLFSDSIIIHFGVSLAFHYLCRNTKAGEGIAFVKLWPLNPKTGTRSSNLCTGFPAPSLDEVASRLSRGVGVGVGVGDGDGDGDGTDMDVEILRDEEGVAAVAKAEARLAAASSASAGAESSADVDEVEAATAQESEVGKAGVPMSTAIEKTTEALAAAPKPLAPAGDATNATTSMNVAAGPDDSGCRDGGLPPTTERKDRAFGCEAVLPPRWLALEVEMFACGSINVSYMMEFIKICFEQVGVGFCL